MTKRKNYLLLTLLLLGVYSAVVAQSRDRQSYIKRFKKIAIAEMEKSGIPASIKLAQGILESADGTSELAQKANNHFGIKCGSNWKGGTYYRKDDDYDKRGILKKSCFRAYKNPEASYMAHTNFLSDPKKKNRYGFLFNYKNTDYKKWAKGLRKAGYATNPQYPKLLIKLIEDHKLYQYDKMSSNQIEDQLASKNKTKQPKVSKHNKVFSHNDVKMAFAKQGDTPLSIAKRFGKSVKRIIKYNEVKATIVFNLNDRVYIQPKRSKFRGKQSIHKVKKGETMHDIAQMYGIKLKKLYKKNKMPQGRQPAIGASISLRKNAKHTPRLLPINGKSPKKRSTPTTKPTKKKKPTKKPSKSNKKPKNTIIHTVKKGDNLYQISRKYGVSVDKIKKLNKLKTNELSIGQKLSIK